MSLRWGLAFRGIACCSASTASGASAALSFSGRRHGPVVRPLLYARSKRRQMHASCRCALARLPSVDEARQNCAQKPELRYSLDHPGRPFWGSIGAELNVKVLNLLSFSVFFDFHRRYENLLLL